ncbi:unnamed protein product [Schistosoma turkestanicum]|nr:unnamed protein product [Schistosoma turkestanicum]
MLVKLYKWMLEMYSTLILLFVGFYGSLGVPHLHQALMCYNCTDCMTVDANTTKIDTCGGCTTQFLDSKIVRGCVTSCINDIVQGPFCCTESLCNNQRLTVNFDLSKAANTETKIISGVPISSSNESIKLVTSSILSTPSTTSTTISTTISTTTIGSEMRNSKTMLNRNHFVIFNCIICIFSMIYVFS